MNKQLFFIFIMLLFIINLCYAQDNIGKYKSDILTNDKTSGDTETPDFLRNNNVTHEAPDINLPEKKTDSSNDDFSKLSSKDTLKFDKNFINPDLNKSPISDDEIIKTDKILNSDSKPKKKNRLRNILLGIAGAIGLTLLISG